MAETVDTVRAACVELRRHPALRRQTDQAAAEAGVRAARANAALVGAELPLPLVRDAVRGAAPYPSDAVGAIVRGAVRAHAESLRLGTIWQQAPLQAMARLHVAACAGLVPEDALGRPRREGEEPLDGAELLGASDAAPAAVDGGEQLLKRLRAVGKLLTNPGNVPAVVVAAAVHAELVLLRPFVTGNAMVARALCRAVVIGRGVDSTGVVVWEQALLARSGQCAQLIRGYADGEQGQAEWVQFFGETMIAGAAEGQSVCDAVLAGRLGGQRV